MPVNRFIYPRTIAIARTAAPGELGPETGKQPYQATRRDQDWPQFEGIAASIQYAGTGRKTGAGLPSDATSLALWKILLPRGAVPMDRILERDVVVDDTGKRYRIEAAYWSPLGWHLRATLLQA